MKQISFNQKIADKKQCVFVILYALGNKPWLNYPNISDKKKDLVVPTCLMINRADGWIGFVGGKVEEGETLEQAVIREVEEEVGYRITSDLEPIVAHEIDPITTHAFAIRLEYEALTEVQRKATEAAHFNSEICGVFLPHLINYQGISSGGQGLSELIKSSLAPSVKEELMHFLLQKKIFTKEDLSHICIRAGYNLEELLQ